MSKFIESKFILAPMVDQSELAWRMFSRKYGFQVCYTPMIHAAVFIKDSTYRRENMQSCSEDRPLIVQFCANNVETFVEAAKLVAADCDAVDLNLGCPQSIAKRGHYGAFLQDDWDLIYKMVKMCSNEVSIPITCKIRIFEDVEKTVKYAQMLESAGAKLLGVHGRTREQKGMNTGLASWPHIQAVCKAVKIPVYSNGNIQFFEDIQLCLNETGCRGVMIAEGSLHNPAICTDKLFPACDLALEYILFVEKYPCPISYVRGHLFKLLHFILEKHCNYRSKVGTCKLLPEFREVIVELQDLIQKDINNANVSEKIPYWICQPYVRPDPVTEDIAVLERRAIKKRNFEDIEQCGLSKNKQKKLLRNCLKTFSSNANSYDLCSCNNPMGLNCESKMCRSCCRSKCYKTLTDCPGHRMWTKKQREINKIKNYNSLEINNDCTKNSHIMNKD